MADGDVTSSVIDVEVVDETCDTQAGSPDKSAQQIDDAETRGEDGEKLCTGNSDDSALPESCATLEGHVCPCAVAPIGCERSGPGQDNIILVPPEVQDSSHSSQPLPAVIDTHSANVMPNQSDAENTPDTGCIGRDGVTKTLTQVPIDSISNSNVNESDHQIAGCDFDSPHSSVSQHELGCKNGTCDGDGDSGQVVKSPSMTRMVKVSESTPDVDSSMSNVSLTSHDSSRATGLTSESFTGSESGLEYESDSYETGSTESSAATTEDTSRSDTSSSSVASPGTKSTSKRVEKVMRRLSETETANSEALDEIQGAIRDTINATMNVLDSDPPSTSSNDSELAASPACESRDLHSHQKKGTVSNDAVKSLPQDNNNHSSTSMPPGGSDMKRYSDNSEELLSELSAELDLVGQTGAIETPNGIASQVVTGVTESKRLQEQLASIQRLCGKQQLELDR